MRIKKEGKERPVKEEKVKEGEWEEGGELSMKS